MAYQYKWTSPANGADHFKKHGHEFKSDTWKREAPKTMDEYTALGNATIKGSSLDGLTGEIKNTCQDCKARKQACRECKDCNERKKQKDFTDCKDCSKRKQDRKDCKPCKEDGSRLFWHHGVFVVTNSSFQFVTMFPVSKKKDADKMMKSKTAEFNSEQELVQFFWSTVMV